MGHTVTTLRAAPAFVPALAPALAPTLARLGLSLAMLVAMPLVASAADATTAADAAKTLTATDLRWLCEQPVVARVKVTRIAVETPDVPCVEGLSPQGSCRMVTADAIVLESLPLLGGARGLSLHARYLTESPNRIRFQLAARDYTAVAKPPFALAGIEGLLGMRQLPPEPLGKPVELSKGVFLPGMAAAQGDLDAACKPLRHWSGQQHPTLPAQLPGDHPARTESAERLARRLAGMVVATPPEPASLEQRFGARLVTGGDATPDESEYRGLAQLESSWVRIRRKAWNLATGRPRVNLSVVLTDPYTDARKVPWWDDDPSDQIHKVPACIRPSMVLRELGDEWPRSELGPPYHAAFRHRYPDYEVTINFMPHGSARGPGQPPNTSDSCIDRMYVFFEPK